MSRPSPGGHVANSREPAVCRAHSNVKNQVEVLVKRRIRSTSLAPSVPVNCLVDRDASEFTVFPHVLVLGKVEKDDLL